MSFLHHPEPDPVHIRGSETGVSYTPDHVADAIVERLAKDGGIFDRVLEPCVGGGAFVRAVGKFPSAFDQDRVTVVDIDPEAPGLALCERAYVGDFAWHNPLGLRHRAFDLAITNPPFGRSVGQDTTLSVVNNARLLAGVCVMLVPLGYLGQVGWKPLIAHAREVWPIIGRVWDHEREMMVVVWDQRKPHETTLLRPLEIAGG